MANIWQNFGRLVKLDFVINGTLIQNDYCVYANTRNRIEIIITIEIEDKNGGKLNVTYDELQKRLFMVNSLTDAVLDDPWKIHDRANEYTVGATDRRSARVRGPTRQVFKYISCREINARTLYVHWSVGINIPGVGIFNTTKSGTITRNCPPGELGEPFIYPKSIPMLAIHSIDYGELYNLTVTVGEFDTVRENLEWESQRSRTESYKKYYNGVCKRRIVRIRPNIENTSQEKFKKQRVEISEEIHNDHVSTGRIDWVTDPPHRVTMECFDLIKFGESPCAVIGCGTDDYQLNIWFPCEANVGFHGNFFLKDKFYCYRFGVNFEDEYQVEDDGSVKIMLYKFILPENNKEKYGWRNIIRDITINVEDEFGNIGEITLGFNNTYFDEPFF